MAIDIEEALVTLATANTDVLAIAGTRIYPDRIPTRRQLPGVVFSRSSGGPVKLLASVSQVKRATIRVECYSADSQQEARELSLAVQQLHGTRGLTGAWWIQFLLLVPDSESDDGIVPIFGDETGAFRSSFDFDVAYNPTGV